MVENDALLETRQTKELPRLDPCDNKRRKPLVAGVLVALSCVKSSEVTLIKVNASRITGPRALVCFVYCALRERVKDRGT